MSYLQSARIVAPLPGIILEACPVIKSFLARQSILLLAGLIFLGVTAWRVHRGYEQRDARTFVADVSKQGGQQAIGGVLMVILGHRLSETGYSPLAWYGALYPFEIVLTTVFTGMLRRMNESYAARLARKRPSWKFVQPLARVGQYGPGGKGDWRWSWYRAQLLQASANNEDVLHAYSPNPTQARPPYALF